MGAPQHCDLLIKNGCVLTMDVRRLVIPQGAVAVKGHTIAAVGPERDILRDWHAAETIDARGGIVHPGYVDAHLHVNAQTCRGFFRGDASKGAGQGGPNYADWKASLTADDEHAAAGLASVEMLRHGITTYVEPGSAFEPDAVADATESVGVRCSLAEPYLWDTTDIMSAIPGLASESLFARVPPRRERCMKLLGSQLFRNRNRDGITHGHIALYGEGTATDELYIAAKTLADREGVILNNHVGFDLDLAAAMERVYGKSRFLHFAEIGVLGPNTTFVHMNLIRDDEIAPIVKSGLSIIWCPLAYVSRGTTLRQHTRIPAMKKLGVNVALGTDSARSSSSGDAGFLALQLANGAGYNTVSEDILEMMTINGARAAGLQHLIGSLEPGKRADIVVRSSGVAELMPGIDPVHQLVTVGHGPNADTVLVNGRVVMQAGRPTRVNEADIFAKAQASVRRIADRLGLSSPGIWPRLRAA
ncbi:MAG TPA: amidohydrolase family protein [Pseudorhodoplanes sp.]|nr:amidohydrolase family protein [Pseudorhodoplanes sp.]